MHTKTSVKGVLRRLLRIMLPAGALPLLTYFIPELNAFTLPLVDLTGPVAVAAYWIAESGGKIGITLMGIALTALLVSRPGIPSRQRVVELLVIVLSVAVLQGGCAYLNEHVVKPAFAIPRPNIIALARSQADSPALGMSVDAFYALPDKALRSEHLRQVLAPESGLHERVRSHWIEESGYSFPSGHAIASMMFATYFLGMGLSLVSGRRLWVFYALAPWAVAVCFSRVLLGVHTPTDVCVGAAKGIVAGTLAFLLSRWILNSFKHQGSVTPIPANA
jgi:phosphatidylglycerophosphatase B